MRSFQELTLSRSSESHAGLPAQPPPSAPHAAVPVQNSGPAPSAGLRRFNAAPAAEAEAALLECYGSRHWARRLADHRPYPDLDALLAAADEAGYDLSPGDRAEALAAEVSPGLRPDAPPSAHLALSAAHAAYESRFGHVFVICLDAFLPAEHPDQVLAGIRARLAHDPEHERVVTADEMRRLARGRIIELVSSQ
ncbi:2-oxo-4-hydroxy-4-carboxy-5-ureidoimidazoline decarboxylase [Streptomyces sp. NPDC001515]